MSLLRSPIKLVALVTSLSAIAFAGYVVQHGPPRPAAAFAASPGRQPPPVLDGSATAIFVGDQYTLGTKDAPSYVNSTCTALRWSCDVDAESGTGYVAPGPESRAATQPYPERLDALERHYPAASVVVVTGGRFDLGIPGTAAAAKRYLAALRTAYPTAQLVVVQPFWDSARRPKELAALDTSLERAAKAIGARWIPTTGWLGSADMATGGLDLTAEGQTALSTQLTVQLRHATSQTTS